MKIINSVLILMCSFSLLGCGGGGGRGVNYDAVCTDSYDPIDQVAKNSQQKLTFEDSLSEVPPGKYNHAGGELFISDPGGSSSGKLAVHYRDVLNEKSGKYGASINCARGFTKSANFDYEVQSYSSMNVDDNKKFDASIRSYKVSFGSLNQNGITQGLVAEFSEKGATQEKPSKMYKGKEAAESEVFLFKTAPNTYEVRAIDTYESGLQIKVISRFRRQDN